MIQIILFCCILEVSFPQSIMTGCGPQSFFFFRLNQHQFIICRVTKVDCLFRTSFFLSAEKTLLFVLPSLFYSELNSLHLNRCKSGCEISTMGHQKQLKPSRNNKGRIFFQLHQRCCFFLEQLAVEKKTPFLVGADRKFQALLIL